MVFVCGIFVLDAQQKNKHMKETEAGDTLVELVHYPRWLKTTPYPNPEWEKFDTATTMSDNNGGLIRF